MYSRHDAGNQLQSDHVPSVGTDTSPDRPNREFLDFAESKNPKNIAIFGFLKKNFFFSWEAFGSRYFVCRIVLGCGGAGEAPKWSILLIFMNIQARNKEIALF